MVTAAGDETASIHACLANAGTPRIRVVEPEVCAPSTTKQVLRRECIGHGGVGRVDEWHQVRWAASRSSTTGGVKKLHHFSIRSSDAASSSREWGSWAECSVDRKCHDYHRCHKVRRLNSSYPGGLVSYIQNAKKLLADSKEGKNPYDGFTPSVSLFHQFLTGASVTFFGQVALPRETTTGKCFLQLYIESILAFQEASCKMVDEGCQTKIPFVIMTSDDTNALTIKLLESNSYFGMEPSQVKILKQEKVACLADNDARLALDPSDKYKIQTKPHGHGDVHSLLYSSGLLEQWKTEGRKWVLFFQDTNGLLFNAIPSALGVSATKGYNVNSLAVPRKAKETIGGITKLTHVDGRTMVINVEYNQLDPLLRATGHPDGDSNCETGYSPYPGNINQLILELGPYIEELKKTHGAISEFVNPKYFF
ncbi:UDP-sugar pyrophosphorylase [Zea mays]|uniref:UDP-sugar pyrophosphorylase n=1 Tax=Zea mays TaxID=4577 RepID=UPI0009A9556E|nr:UDP-sugar pyrophosphorylase [Zea mays]|eukprot:XP_020393510.1 UDP-sugar pyrophosphorylase [Zea mays]